MITQTNIFSSTLWNSIRNAVNGAFAQVRSHSVTDGLFIAMAAGAVATVTAIGADMARSSGDLGLGRVIAQLGTEAITGIERGIEKVLPKSSNTTLGKVGSMLLTSMILGFARRVPQTRPHEPKVVRVLKRGIPFTIFAVTRSMNALMTTQEILREARIASAVQEVSGPRPIMQAVLKALLRGSLPTIALNALVGALP